MEGCEHLREQLTGLLVRSHAHADFDDVVEGIAPDVSGVRPEGLPHSPWELLEHIRLAQRDILEFCLESDYAQRVWPSDYWPRLPGPPTPEAWDESVAAVHRDRTEFQKLIADEDFDLFAIVPHGTTQTYLREVLMVADHTAYHLGQLGVVARLLAGKA